MKFTRSFVIILFLFLNSIVVSQTSETFSKVEKSYVDYFSLEPETIFTHVNKSSYFKDEHLWFKSYIYNIQNQKPYLTSTNVYASIYDEKGNLVEKKLFYAELGMTHGDFDLSDKYLPGIYFLKVSTNWMRNFNEPHFSIQQFEVLGNTDVPKTISTTDPQFDFQMMPEGGQLLNNVINSIGFKITDINGEGVEIDFGIVTDSKNNLITTFKGNRFGLGKFNLFLDENQTYTVTLTLLDGSKLTQQISNGKHKGFAISINNLNPDNLFLGLRTNKSTLPELLNEVFYLIIHRDGLIKKIDFNFEPNKLDYLISISRPELHAGLNILTLFNSKSEPILERMVFNNPNGLQDQIEFLGLTKQKDSVQIRLRASKEKNNLKNISISVLPKSTKAYTYTSNIKSTFWLEPYLKGHIESPNYYFETINRKVVYDLDLLLLTQGWSSYSWQNIFYKPQKAHYPFESGLTIKGKVNGENRSKEEIVLFSQENQLMLNGAIDDNNYFSFNHLFLVDSTQVSFSIPNKKGRLSSPNIYYNLYPNKISDSIVTSKYLKSDLNLHNSSISDFIFDNTVILDTVSLSGASEKPKNRVLRGEFGAKHIKFDDRDAAFRRITDIIRENGFDVIEHGLNISITSRRYRNLRGASSPNVYLDNSDITGYLDVLSNLTVNDVEEIYISTIASGVGQTGGNINIFTKKSIEKKHSTNSSFNSSLIKMGFSLPKKYYSPLYDKSQTQTFADYAAINWIPNVTMDGNGEFIFNIPAYYFDSISLHINGMCADGKLIAKTETIGLNSN